MGDKKVSDLKAIPNRAGVDGAIDHCKRDRIEVCAHEAGCSGNVAYGDFSDLVLRTPKHIAVGRVSGYTNDSYLEIFNVVSSVSMDFIIFIL